MGIGTVHAAYYEILILQTTKAETCAATRRCAFFFGGAAPVQGDNGLKRYRQAWAAPVAKKQRSEKQINIFSSYRHFLTYHFGLLVARIFSRR